MNKNSNDIEGPQNDIFGGAMSEEEFLNKENGGEENDWDRFYEQAIIDIFINNNDRNNGNWGILRENDWEDDDEGSPCEVYDAVMSAIFLSRPLGILWEDSLIEKFLQAKGYKIVERTDDDGEVYTVPVKVGSKIIPDRRDSLRRIFDQEVQETLINWLISLG